MDWVPCVFFHIRSQKVELFSFAIQFVLCYLIHLIEKIMNTTPLNEFKSYFHIDRDESPTVGILLQLTQLYSI